MAGTTYRYGTAPLTECGVWIKTFGVKKGLLFDFEYYEGAPVVGALSQFGFNREG
jgi:hypothetical protein